MDTTLNHDAPPQQVGVWDPLVRIVHWSLVAAFLITYVSGEEASGLHVWAGYAVLAFMALRTLWGFVGPRHARFRDFVCRPGVIIAYAKDVCVLRAKRYLGHNPLGGAMIVLMLVTLTATGVTGIALQQAETGGWFADAAATLRASAPAPIAAARASDDEDDEDSAEWLEELHELLAHLMVALVLAHIAGVALSSALHRENLVSAMFTGRKRV